ncbi:hypothetical protein BDM02DRAFT_3187503 [Thelephora ganbajun]|uniref:Uncharacterized protein n=1 Tax=Thelephora ganbajun TaxID=370292 RepID=A0ACB6ZF03_THEGA|nr:hypothetical protein BDM02DRAFT_3187503 [Thelephora ganbajun]
MNLGRGPVEKTFTIVYGYLLVGISLVVYTNMTVDTIKTAEKALRIAVRRQLLVVKVAVFIIIELITFPLGCGVILGPCTIRFSPEVSLKARLVFMQHASLAATPYHWVVGTTFMYMFATSSVVVARSCVLG